MVFNQKLNLHKGTKHDKAAMAKSKFTQQCCLMTAVRKVKAHEMWDCNRIKVIYIANLAVFGLIKPENKKQLN